MVILWVFSLSFLPAVGCSCHGLAMTCGDGDYGGLWLLQWWLWQVERWYGVVEEVVAIVFIFFYSCFIIILMSNLYYLNEMVKSIKILMFDIS